MKYFPDNDFGVKTMSDFRLISDYEILAVIGG
jgi:hypothetical protein